MKIQKGIVKYKDRADIVCTYAVTDDGKSYYFLDANDEKKFKNGNRIATTTLVEAIDPMVKASTIGVIDENGNEVIPFTNRSIRPVNDDIILVETSTPITESVIEANTLKSDPLAATKLVATPALIKDKLNSKMGTDGRYIFNDQFSEATVCDINGNNLVNGEYFSFIGISEGKLYFSKNTADSEITEYSILPPEVQSDVTPANDTQAIDVSEVQVPSETIEKALTNENVNAGFDSSEVTPVKLDDQGVENNENLMADIQIPAIQGNNEKVIEENSVEENNEVTPIAPAEPVSEIATLGSEPVSTDVAENVQGAVGTDEFTIPTIDADDPEEALNNEGVIPEEVVNTVSEDVPATDVVEETNEVTEDTQETEEVAEEETNEVAEDSQETEEVAEEETNEVAEDTQKTEEVAEEETNEVAEDSQETEEVAEEETDEVTEDSQETEEVAEEETDEVAEDSQETEEVAEEETIPMNIAEEDDEVEEATDVDVDDSLEDTALDNMVNEVTSARDVDSDLNEDIFSDSVVKADSIEIDEDDDDNYYVEDDYLPKKDTIMADVAKSMAGLIKQNRDLKMSRDSLNAKYEKVVASRRNVTEKAKMLEEKVNALNVKNQNLDTKLIKLESRNDILENKTRDQERIIESQRRELDNLRAQLDGKEELSRLLQDAKVMLEDNSSYGYDEDNYYSKVA